MTEDYTLQTKNSHKNTSLAARRHMTDENYMCSKIDLKYQTCLSEAKQKGGPRLCLS